MPKLVRLDSLRLQVRQRIHRESDDPTLGFINDAELTQYINNSIGEYDDLLLLADASTRRKTTSPISVVAGTDTYGLPSDFLHLLKVEVQLDTTRWLRVLSVPFAELDRWSLAPPPVLAGVPPFRYCLNSDGTAWSLILAPVPYTSATIRAWYAPVLANLVAAGDTIDGINGLEEYVIVDVAMKCLLKEKSDVSALMAEKQALRERIEETAKDRDQGAPKKMGAEGGITGWDGGSGPYGDT